MLNIVIDIIMSKVRIYYIISIYLYYLTSPGLKIICLYIVFRFTLVKIYIIISKHNLLH